jgi:AraC-like DNA-binding protein
MAEPVADALSAAPDPQLAGLVSRYSGDRYEGFAPGTHLGLPSRTLTVVFSLGSPLEIATMPDRSRPPGRFTALAAGLHTRPAAIAHDGNQHSVSVELTPAGARPLLGVPAGELAGAVVDLEDLLGPQVRELLERMAAAPTWKACFAVLDAVLTRRAPERAQAERTMAAAWDRIVESGGTVRIADLAADVGYSRRQLSKRFLREYGLTPKQAARVVRFERSWLLLRQLERTRRASERVTRPALADVAVQCGYYDQAHLAREWNELAGCPPSAWLAAEEFPFLQDSTAEPAVASPT